MNDPQSSLQEMLQKNAVPLSIVVAGLVIAAAIVYSGDSGRSIPLNPDIPGGDLISAEKVRKVDSSDHVRGGSAARVTIVEYSDYECPYCSTFHPVLQQVLEEYSGKLRWVYRHFPLSSIHQNADSAAVAAECIAEIGGNDAFWSFTDSLFVNQNRLGASLYEELAEGLGLNSINFKDCLSDPKILEKVNADRDNAVESGGRGTPYSVVIGEDGSVFPIPGALHYEEVKRIIDLALGN